MRGQESHYIKLEREFNTDHQWVWYIHALLTASVFIWYCVTSGRELLYALYIPLDILLNVSLVVFFWYERYKAKVKKDKMKKKMDLVDAIEMAEDAVDAAVDNYTDAGKLNRMKNRLTSQQVKAIKAEKKLKKERHL